MRRLASATALYALIFSPAFAAENVWLGTWKFDPTKSHLTGETVSFTHSKDGTYHFSDESTFTDDFYIDGKEHSSAFDHTTTWRTAGDRAWDVQTKMSGEALTTKHYELSADEKTLTVTTTGVKPDGTEFKNLTVFARVSGTNGLIGRWRSTHLDISSPDILVVSSPTPGVLRWDVAANKQSVEGRPNGEPHAVTGPTVPKGLTMSFKTESASSLSYIFRIAGKPETYGLQTLSDNQRSFSDVYWHPGKKDEKITEVYVKQ